MGFERFKDADTGRTFLYNASTGETKWDSPALIPGRDVLSPIINNSNEENSGSGRIEGVEMTSMSRLEAGVISSVDPNLYDDSESETEGEEDDDDEGGLLTPNKIRAKRKQRGEGSDERIGGGGGGGMVRDLTSDALIATFPVAVCMHAFCCEAPGEISVSCEDEHSQPQ